MVSNGKSCSFADVLKRCKQRPAGFSRQSPPSTWGA